MDDLDLLAVRVEDEAVLAHDGAAAEGVSEAVIAWSEAVKGQGAPTRTFRFALGGLVEAHAAITEACEDAP